MTAEEEECEEGLGTGDCGAEDKSGHGMPCPYGGRKSEMRVDPTAPTAPIAVRGMAGAGLPAKPG